ncbi:MAG: zeta toxin family protein [Nocardioidaceae bacterium]|nr:zeta toxin family protein [Nocardioidaceae bacterium]
MASSPLTMQEQSDFDQYALAVDVYASTWWDLADEPQKSRLKSAPHLRSALDTMARDGRRIPTSNVYQDAGHWIPVRELLQDTLIANELGEAGGSAEGSPNACYFLLGLPGSGKTSVLREVARAHAAAAGLALSNRVSDADQLRKALPEFASGLGSDILQEEVVSMTYGDSSRPRARSLEEGVMRTAHAGSLVMIDVVGDPKYLPGSVTALAERGWTVFVLVTQCSADEAVIRATRRALSDGRYTPLDLIWGSNLRPVRALNAALRTEAVDGWALIDTEDSPARVVRGDGAFGDNGTLISLPV